MQAEPKKMHPGVSLWQKVAGGTYYAMFRDPRNEKQKRALPFSAYFTLCIKMRNGT